MYAWVLDNPLNRDVNKQICGQKCYIHTSVMKRILYILMLVMTVQVLLAQERCMTMRESEVEMANDTVYARGVMKLQQLAEAFAAGDSAVDRNDWPFPTLTVPIVVHVLYRTEQQNISMEQIHSQIEVLNRDFAGLNADLNKVPEPFRRLAGVSNIQFQLADRDPDGRFTNGVTRTKTAVENIGSQSIYHRPERGGVAPWPQPHYLNVWVCELEGDALGFAILPGAQISERDGIVMSPTAFGTIGTTNPPYDQGRTFVHEVGHYFGLRHLWGSDDASCNSTDYVSDTPVQLKENFGCKNFPSFSCSNEEFGDMFMNYMDYGNDTCMLFFTQQQVALMHLVLMKNRKTLFHSAGVTGTPTVSNERQLHVYPNPSSSEVFIEFGSTALGWVEVVDMKGILVHRSYHEGQRAKLTLDELAPGLYFVRTTFGVSRLSML